MSHDPFAADFQNVPQNSSNKTCLIAVLVLGGLLASCICCGGASYFLIANSVQELVSQAKTQIPENQVIQEHIGEIRSSETGVEYNVIIKLNGSKGNGTLRIPLDQNTGKFNPDLAELILSDGTVLPLKDANEKSQSSDHADSGEPDAPPPAPDTAAPNN